jgi:hypothetical protein
MAFEATKLGSVLLRFYLPHRIDQLGFTLAKAREVEVSTRAFDGRDTVTVLVPGEQDDAATAISGSRKLAYLPR